MKSIRKAVFVLIAIIAAACLFVSACRRDQSAESMYGGASFVFSAQRAGDAL